MKMKMVMIAALAAAPLPLTAAPTDAAGAPIRQAAAEEPLRLAAADVDTRVGDGLGAAGEAQAESQAAQEDREPKKRKSTGDKVLTGVAVVLGIGALAVGGLLVAIFAN
jgi:hypothetical protein